MKTALKCTLFISFFSIFSFSQQTAETQSGKKVKLYQNGTWEYISNQNTTITNKTGEYLCLLKDYYIVDDNTYVIADFIDSKLGQPIRNKTNESFIFLFKNGTSIQGNLYCEQFNRNELDIKDLLNGQVFRIELKNGVILCLGQQMGF